MKDILTEDFMRELGIDQLSEDEREETMARIGKLVFEGVMIRVIDSLSEEDQKNLQNIINEEINAQETSDKILEFLRSKINNLDQIIDEEINVFKKESLETMNAIKK